MDELIFRAQNPWKDGKTSAPPLLNRALFDVFEGDLERPHIQVLLGARQTGKTTLLREIARRAT